MFGLTDRGNKIKANSAWVVGNVLVLLSLHGCNRQEATNQETNTLVNKPKLELPRD